MGCLEGIYQPAAVLRLQRGLHLFGSKREERSTFLRKTSLKYSTDPPFPCGDTNICPLTLGEKHPCLDYCRCGVLERMGIPGVFGILRRWAAMGSVLGPLGCFLLLTTSLSVYHSAKKEYQETAKVPKEFNQEALDRGFNTSGLWAYSRHPNFAAEQSGWVLLYGWSCWVTQTYYNWSIIGAVAYLILFQASTWFTELISARKYPEYKEYQKRVGKFLPKLPGGPPGDFSDKRNSK